MPIQILMPALSPTMTEGKLAKWTVKEGDTVASGDILAEIETDKATMELEAVDEGTVGRILVPEGTEGVAVNTPIALLLAEGEDASALDAAAPKAAPAPAAAPVAAAPSPAAPPMGGGVVASLNAILDGKPAAALAAPAGGRVFASPLARRIARDAGIEIARVAPTGPHGRIVRADVEAAIAGGTGEDKALKDAMALALAVAPPPGFGKPAAAPGAAPAAAPAPVADFGTPFTEVPHTSMRKIIARRLTESKQTVPHFYVGADVRIDDLLDLRARINDRAKDGGGTKVSVNDFVIRASAVALARMPDCNVSWTETAMRKYGRADVSVAVATPAGLITPIVRDAASKTLGAISTEMKALAARARDGKLMPEEYQGGCFSVSNLGMFGLQRFSAIINPPQSMILAVGAGEQRPVVKDGALGIGTVMTLTLSCDHRCIDGALGAQFIGLLKSLLEDPFAILL